MTGVMAADDDERAIELSTIEAIFPELLRHPERPFDASIEIPVALNIGLRLRSVSSRDGEAVAVEEQARAAVNGIQELPVIPTETLAGKGALAEDLQTVAFLPPVSIQISLPEGYPSSHPPSLTITTSPPWLPRDKVKALLADGPRLWEELGRDQVIFTYLDHVRQQSEDAFGLGDDATDIWDVPQDIKIALLDFDLKMKRKVFENETFTCGVCLEPKKGSACHRMQICAHVFCVQCLQDFYNSSILEGEVDNVKCLDPSCGKAEKIAHQNGLINGPSRRRRDPALNPSELLEIPLAHEVVQRYVDLKRKKKLDSDKSTIYCPRSWCRGVARSKKHPKPLDPLVQNFEDASEPEIEQRPPNKTKRKKSKKEEDLPPMSERLCICEDCSYAFCAVCKKGWHGELSVCNPRKQSELNAEEKASAEYLKLFTTPCPTCSALVQKTMGCNHMVCFQCKTHFCYLCSSYLESDNPYRHFNDFKNPCYMRLWELEGGDGQEAAHHGFQGGAAEWMDAASDEESAEDDDSDEESVHAGDNEGNIVFGDDSDSEDDVWPGLPEAGVVRRQPEDHTPNRDEAPAAPERRAGPRNPPMFNARVRRQNEAGRGRRRIFEAAADLEDEMNAEIQQPQRVVAPPGQQNNAAMQPAPLRAIGLERFLALARANREDEWDSDELEEGFDEDEAINVW